MLKFIKKEDKAMAEKKTKVTKKPNYVKDTKPGYDRWDNSGVRVAPPTRHYSEKKGK